MYEDISLEDAVYIWCSGEDVVCDVDLKAIVCEECEDE